jgi:hypothetical protein
MSVDYRILYRRRLDLCQLREVSKRWSLFLSAFNTSERVLAVHDAVTAPSKHWLVHAEYGFDATALPSADSYLPKTLNEAEFWQAYELDAEPDLSGVVCVDVTGFMRPHLAFLVAWLFERGVQRFVALYTDPQSYEKQEDTEFTKGPVVEVRQIAGFEGVHSTESSNDLLVIGAGYDDELIRRVAEHKTHARKLQMFGLPSLEADMYQQSVVRAARAAEAVGPAADRDVLFAPANDPFVTAHTLQERIRAENGRSPITNLYLASVGTKPQMLGFALFYLTEMRGTATSMLFPFAERYSQETSKGIARTWMYEVEALT